ncbi:GlxA family transcriptional regulator [Mariniluteicoccus flavus]
MTTPVRFLLPPGLHLLDLAGPAQVFSTANDHGGAYVLEHLAETSTVATHQGVELAARTDWPEPDGRGLVVVPGWRVGTGRVRQPLGKPALQWIRHHMTAGGEAVSVCAGAWSLAAAGVLDGRRATTHHDVQAALAARFPRVTVVPDVLFVDDGPIHTSAGIASGIDLALHLVARDLGPAASGRVARAMVVYARRNGDEPQQSVLLGRRAHLVDAVHRAQDVIEGRYADPLPLELLAGEVGVSARTLTRLFAHALGTTPLRHQQAVRVEHAERLVGQGWTRQAAARAVGFADARMLRRLVRERAG